LHESLDQGNKEGCMGH